MTSTELVPTKMNEVCSSVSAGYWEAEAARYALLLIEWSTDAWYRKSYPEAFYKGLHHLWESYNRFRAAAKFDRTYVAQHGDKIAANLWMYGSPLGWCPERRPA